MLCLSRRATTSNRSFLQTGNSCQVLVYACTLGGSHACPLPDSNRRGSAAGAVQLPSRPLSSDMPLPLSTCLATGLGLAALLVLFSALPAALPAAGPQQSPPDSSAHCRLQNATGLDRNLATLWRVALPAAFLVLAASGSSSLSLSATTGAAFFGPLSLAARGSPSLSDMVAERCSCQGGALVQGGVGVAPNQ